MAQEIRTLFIDDLDGGEAEGTVRFGLDGTDYEIDLSKEHTDVLHAALGTYVEHARKVGGTPRRQGRRGADAGRRCPPAKSRGSSLARKGPARLA